MKTLTAAHKTYLVLLLITINLFSITNTAISQRRNGGGNGTQRGESINRGGSAPDNTNIQRRNTVRNVDRNINRGNVVRQNRNNITNRPVTNNIARPRTSTPVTARPANTIAARPRYGSIGRPAYRPVYGYGRPVYSAINPGWRYGFLPRRNVYFSSLPTTYLTIGFGGIGYRYWNGVFYRPYNNLFMVAPPPVGIVINVLPVGYRTIRVRDYPYYYYNGIYYDKQQDNTYHVVSPPVGAVVESLPQGYETVVIDGETYYTIDGAQYKPTVKENGEIWYEVIKAN